MPITRLGGSIPDDGYLNLNETRRALNSVAKLIKAAMREKDGSSRQALSTAGKYRQALSPGPAVTLNPGFALVYLGLC